MSLIHDIELTIHGIEYLVYVTVEWGSGKPLNYKMDWFRWTTTGGLIECAEPEDTKPFHRLYLRDEAVWRDLAADEEREVRDEKEYQRICNTPENRWAEEMERRAELKREREEGC